MLQSYGDGVEIGSLDTFHSSSTPSNGRGNFVSRSASPSELKAQVQFENQSITYIDRYADEHRLTCFKFLSDGYYMDLVQRWVVPVEEVQHWRIGAAYFHHKRENRYNQFSLQDVFLTLRDGRQIQFSSQIISNPTALSPKVYVRDEPTQWVFHVRLLATCPDITIFKGCTRTYNRPFPNSIQTFIRTLRLDKKLLYVRERVSQRIPFQTQGAVKVPKGASVIIKTRTQFVE